MQKRYSHNPDFSCRGRFQKANMAHNEPMKKIGFNDPASETRKSKAAVHNLSKNLAREWATAGVRVNILMPGFFPAEQNRKVLNPERVAQIMGQTPMKRFGEAHELVGATLLLASDAGSFITGAEIVVDGGFDAMSI